VTKEVVLRWHKGDGFRRPCIQDHTVKYSPPGELAPVSGLGATVALLSPSSGLGGAERQTEALAGGLRDLGFHVKQGQVTDDIEADVTIWWGAHLGKPERRAESIYVAHSSRLAVPDDVDTIVGVCAGVGDVTIWNGVDPEPFKNLHLRPRPAPGETFTVGWLGRYSAEKNPLLAVEVLSQLPDNFRLVMHGSGPLRVELHNAWDSWKPGFIERLDIGGVARPEDALARYDCLLITSDVEGCPLVAIEAMHAGVPVVACGQGDLTKLLSHGRGYDVSKDNLSRYVEEIARDPGRAQDIADRARAFAAEHLTVKKMALQYAELIREKVPEPRARCQINASDPRPRILLLADQPDTAFAIGHRDLMKYCGEWFDFDMHVIQHWPEEPFPDMSRYDAIYVPYTRWQFHNLLPFKRCLGANRSTDFDRLNPGQFGAPEATTVNRFRGFQVVNEMAHELANPWCPNVVLLPNPVDMDRFPEHDKPEGFIAHWNGNRQRQDLLGRSVKRFDEIVRPAASAAGVTLDWCGYNEPEGPHQKVPSEDMPARYRGVHCLVHASRFEGCSKTLLEAMASGCVVASTEVGTVRQMVDQQMEEWGEAGITIPSLTNWDGFANHLVTLRDNPERVARMGEINRETVRRWWSWEKWAPKYKRFLEMAL